MTNTHDPVEAVKAVYKDHARLSGENERLKRLLDQRGKDAADAEDEVERLRKALRIAQAALDAHPRWCGYNRDAPGDGIVNEARVAIRKALDL
jgi:hypothetical protein